MKRYTHYIRLALLATTLFATTATFAQNRQARATAPRDGFWVVESQPKKQCVVYFYNQDRQLIYQETLAKKHLNIKRATTRQSLNTVLEQAIKQWAQLPQPGNAPLAGNQRLLAAEFDH